MGVPLVGGLAVGGCRSITCIHDKGRGVHTCVDAVSAIHLPPDPMIIQKLKPDPYSTARYQTEATHHAPTIPARAMQPLTHPQPLSHTSISKMRVAPPVIP